MARPYSLPSQVFDHVADQALAYLPETLPPAQPTGPAVSAQTADVSLPQHALDAVEGHISLIGQSNLPDIFGIG